MPTFNVQAALQAGYSKQEIDGFLRQKENKNLQTSGYSAPSKPFGEGILGSILNPVARYGQTALGAGYELYRGGKSALGDKNAYFNQETGQVVENPFLSQQQLSSFNSKGSGLQNVGAQLATQNSGVRQGLKDTANVASYAVPFGKGANFLSKVLAPGASSGALQALSAENVSPLSVVGGGVGGAASAGILQGLGILGSKAAGGAKKLLDKGGQSLVRGAEEKATQEFIKASPSGFQRAVQEHGFDPRVLYKKYAEGLGYDDLLGPIASKGRGGALKATLDDAEGLIQATAKNSGNNIKISGDDLIKALKAERRAIGNELGGQNRKAALDEIIKQAEKKYKNGTTVKKALTTLRSANERFGKAVVDDSGDAVATAAQKLEANTLRSTLKKMFPELADALDTQSEVLTLRPFIERARASVSTTGAGKSDLGLSDLTAGFSGATAGGAAGGPIGAALGFGAGIAGRKAVESPTVQKGVGNALATAAQTQSPQFLNSPLLRNALLLGASRTGSSLGSGIGGQVPAQNTNQPSYGEGGNNGNNNVENPLNQDNLPSNLPGSISQNITADQVMAAQLYLPPQIAERIKAAYDIQQSSAGGSLNATQIKDQNFARSGLRSLEKVKQLIGPGKLAANAIPGKLGARDYDNAAFAATDALLRLRTGAQAPETEVRRYQKSLFPALGDSQETINQKLSEVEAIFNDTLSQKPASQSEILQGILRAGM